MGQLHSKILSTRKKKKKMPSIIALWWFHTAYSKAQLEHQWRSQGLSGKESPPPGGPK